MSVELDENMMNRIRCVWIEHHFVQIGICEGKAFYVTGKPHYLNYPSQHWLSQCWLIRQNDRRCIHKRVTWNRFKKASKMNIVRVHTSLSSVCHQLLSEHHKYRIQISFFFSLLKCMINIILISCFSL